MWVRNMSAILLAVASFGAYASESFWSSEVEVGAVVTTGNTDERNLKFVGSSTADSERFLHALNLDVLNSSKNGEKTAQKAYFSYQADYKLEGDHALFGRIAYEDDKFSGFDYQLDTTAGYNRQLLKNETMNLKGAVGAGFRFSETTAGETEDEVILRLAANYSWKVSPTATFKQLLSTEIGSNSTISRSETSLSTTVIGDIAMKLAVKLKHTSEVPVGRDKLDTETSMTLVYKF